MADDRRLQVILEVIDKASSAIKGIGSNLSDFAKKAQGAGLAMAGAGGAITGALALAVNAAKEERIEINQLDQALRNAGSGTLELSNATKYLGELEEGAAKRSTDLTKAQEAHADAVDKVENAQFKLLESQAKLTSVQENSKSTALDLMRAQKGVDDASRGLADAQETLTTTTDTLAGAQQDVAWVSQNVAAAEGQVEAAQKKVNESSQTNTLSYEKNKAAIEEVITAEQKLSNFSDGEMRSALRRLVEITGDYEHSLAALPAAIDLAAATGMDLEQASVLIGKALNGNDEALKRYGISLEGASGPTEVLAKLTERFGGSAEAARDPMTQLKNQLANVAEVVGATLLPALNTLMGIMLPIIQRVLEWTEAHPTLTKVIVIVGGVLGLLATAIGAVLLILPGLIAGITAVGTIMAAMGITVSIALGPLTLIVVALAAIGIAAYLLYKNWEEVWGFITSTAEQVWSFISDLFNSKWGWLLPGGLYWKAIQFALDHWQSVWNTILEIANTIWSALTTAWEATVGTITAIWDALVTAAETAWNVIKTIIEIATFPLLIAIGVAWIAFQELVIPLWNLLLEVATSVFNAIKDVVLPIFETIRDVSTEIWNTIRDVITTVWEEIRNAIETAINAVSEVIHNVWNEIKGFIENEILNPIRATFDTVWGAIRKIVETAIIGLTVFIHSVLNPIVGVITAVWNPLLGVFERIWNGIRGVVGGAVDFIIGRMWELIGVAGDVINTVGGALGKVIDFADKLHDLGADVLGKIGLQHGGLVQKGGLAVVGEAGPELVALPGGSRVYSNTQSRGMVAKFGGMGGGTGQLILQFNAPIYGMLDFRDEVMSAVRAAMNSGGLSDLIAPTAERVFR